MMMLPASSRPITPNRSGVPDPLLDWVGLDQDELADDFAGVTIALDRLRADLGELDSSLSERGAVTHHRRHRRRPQLA